MNRQKRKSIEQILEELNLSADHSPDSDQWQAFLNTLKTEWSNPSHNGSNGHTGSTFTNLNALLESEVATRRIEQLVNERSFILRERAEQAENYINALPDLILQVDLHGAVIGFKGFKKNSEISIDQTVFGENIANIWPKGADQLMAAIEQTFATGEISEIRTDLQPASNRSENAPPQRPVPVEIRISKIDEESLLLIFRDNPIAASAANMSEAKQRPRRPRHELLGRQEWVNLAKSVAKLSIGQDQIDLYYKEIIKLFQETFDFYHVQFFNINELRKTLVLAVGAGKIGDRMVDQGLSYPIEESYLGDVLTNQAPKFWPDIYQEQRWSPHPLLKETRSEIAFPLIFNDQMVGIAHILFDHPNAIETHNIIALDGVIQKIADIGEIIRIRQELNELHGEHERLLDLFSRDGWNSIRSNSSNPRGYLFDQTATRPIDGALTEINGEEMPAIQLTSTSGRLIVRPIDVRGEVVGTLGIQDSIENPLTAEDHLLIEQISTQISNALENARLLTQTQKRAVELQTVAEVSFSASNILNRSKLLNNVVNLTKTRFGLYHANLYLLDEDKRTLRLVAASGEIGELLVKEGWKIDAYAQESLAGQVVRTRQSVILGDVRADAVYLQNPRLPDTRSELSLPLNAGNEILGVLSLQSDQLNWFNEDDVQVHTTLGNQIAIALQNALLYEEQLETADRLREVDHLKNEFLASMSHELRTPLNSIIGFADVLLEGIDGELNDRMIEDVTMIRDGGRHLRNLIGDILDMSKIEAGMMDLNYAPLDLRRIGEEVMNQIAVLIAQKDVELRLEVDESIDTIEADRTRLTQIFTNLLSNAAKFTDKGSITLSIERTNNNFARISIADTGIGIKKEDLQMVFERFRQVGGMINQTGGTGLGLPITKNLIELHGGEIWVDSIYDVGTTFTFTLPLNRRTDIEK